MDSGNIHNNNDSWSLIIKPKKRLSLNLTELKQYKDLIYLMVRRDFVSQYKQTILGPLWFIIHPLLMTFIFYVVFGRIANISTDGMPHMLFYMSAYIPWSYFAACLTNTSKTFVVNANIFGKVYFPRLVVPISIITSNLITFFIQFILLLGFILYFWLNGTPITWNKYTVLIPVLIILMAAAGLGFGLIVSSFTTKYRDLAQLISFGVQIWMYITPVIYPMAVVSENYRSLVLLNPLAPLIESFRYAMLGMGYHSIISLVYSTVVIFIVLIIGIIIFNKVERTFMDTV